MNTNECVDRKLYYKRYDALSITAATIVTAVLDYGSFMYDAIVQYVSGVLKFNEIYLTTIDPVELLQHQLNNADRAECSHQILKIDVDLIDPDSIAPPRTLKKEVKKTWEYILQLYRGSFSE